jgi:ABC-type Fe3+ transport system substrate-binding protein
MPGQPMYFVIPKKTAHPEEAKKFVEFVTSPEFQAKEIVMRFNWYPGIDGSNLKGRFPRTSSIKSTGMSLRKIWQKRARPFPWPITFPPCPNPTRSGSGNSVTWLREPL